MSTVISPAEQRVIVDDVSWSTYLRLCEADGGRRGRMSYDQGTLEIMSPSKLHEHAKRLLGRMVEAYTEERGIGIESVSSTTFQRGDLQRGFEADECYYVEHAEAVRGMDDIDLTVDPPPDLVIEIDISHSSMNKAGIYSALGVPEIWRYDGRRLRVFLLDEDDYVESPTSRAFPQLPLAELVRFLDRRSSLSETQLIRAFREWVRKQPTDT
jgi:Uma2 family endonuclease